MNFDRVDLRMRQVHEQNLKDADAAGMTLEAWHEAMSEKGRGVEPVLVKKRSGKVKYVPKSATEQVLHQLFPNAHKDE
ncbi:MAG: hypothetical protein WA152_03390 [Microgenomates group bacterium]